MYVCVDLVIRTISTETAKQHKAVPCTRVFLKKALSTDSLLHPHLERQDCNKLYVSCPEGP